MERDGGRGEGIGGEGDRSILLSSLAPNVPLGLIWEEGMEWNEMKRNEKNNFRIFFPFLIWEF